MAQQVRPTVTVEHLPWLKTRKTFSAAPEASKHFPRISSEREQMQTVARVARVGGASPKK
jgi:hypothetical protein